MSHEGEKTRKGRKHKNNAEQKWVRELLCCKYGKRKKETRGLDVIRKKKDDMKRPKYSSGETG